MKILKSPQVKTSDEDDFLYERLMKLLNQMRLVQGGTALDASLRRHRDIRIYLMAKQIEKIRYIEETYFNEDGTVNYLAVQNYHIKNRSLQNN